MSNPLKSLLHAGCGRLDLSYLPEMFHTGWSEVRVDIDPAVEPDIVADMTDMAEISSGNFDAVYSSQNLEHLYPDQVALALAEFARVLIPGGMVFIKTPDLEVVADAIRDKGLDGVIYQSGMGPITALDMIYGHTGKISEGNRYMAHHTGFTADTLSKRLSLSGFVGVAVNRLDYSLWATGHKPSAG
jgi:SAM-dependent methyltransferase